MIEINLVPDVKRELINAERIRSKVIMWCILIGLISIAIVILLIIYVFMFQAVRNKFADDAIKQGSDKLLSVEDLSKTLTIQNQLTKISAINNSKKIDSRIFNLINVIIPQYPNGINISSLKIDSATSLVTIEGQAPNSYAAVEVFKKTIDAAKVKYIDDNKKQQEVKLTVGDIVASDMSYGEDSSGTKVLRFTLRFEYVKELISLASKNASVAITTNGNVTDSYLGVPKSVFADRAKDLKEGQ